MTREWRDLAACAGRAPEFDATVEGETDQQRIDRHGVAKYVCNNECPVRAECKADFVKHVDSGVRFGEVHGLPRGAIVGMGNGNAGLRAKKQAKTVELTERIMELTAQGMSAAQVGDKLGITRRAVVRHRAEGRYQAELRAGEAS